MNARHSQPFTIAGLEYAQECCKYINLHQRLLLTDNRRSRAGCVNEINSPGAPFLRAPVIKLVFGTIWISFLPHRIDSMSIITVIRKVEVQVAEVCH